MYILRANSFIFLISNNTEYISKNQIKLIHIHDCSNQISKFTYKPSSPFQIEVINLDQATI